MTLTWQQRMDALTALHVGMEAANTALDVLCDMLCIPHQEPITVDDAVIDEYLAELESALA